MRAFQWMVRPATPILVAALILAISGSGAAFADFNSKDAKKAGFKADPGEYKGAALDTSAGNNEQKKVDDAIARLKGAAGGASDECEKGLDDMNKGHRICREDGKHKDKADGTTLPDGKAGADGDGMNLSGRLINRPTDILACALVHEWVHVNQTGPYPELPAYEAQKKCLEDLGANSGAYYKWVCCKVDSLKGVKKEEPKSRLERVFAQAVTSTTQTPLPAPIPTGFAELHLDNATFFIDETDFNLKSFLPGDLSFSFFPLAMTSPLNLIRIPGAVGPAGGTMVAVSGVSSGTGVLEYVELDPAGGTAIQSVLTLSLSGIKPLGLSSETYLGLQLLYVLDTQNQQILLFYDADGDLLPETVLPQPWATAAAFPALQTARSIQQNTALPLSVLVTSRDLRIAKTVDLGKAVTGLVDANADGVADVAQGFAERDLVAVIPWPFVAPVAGDSQLTAFATAGSTIELWQSDASGNEIALLGSAVAGSDNLAVISVTTPLTTGQYLLLKDVTYLFADPPVPFQVQ